MDPDAIAQRHSSARKRTVESYRHDWSFSRIHECKKKFYFRNVKNRTCTYLLHYFIMLINMAYHISDSVFILCTAHDTMISVQYFKI